MKGPVLIIGLLAGIGYMYYRISRGRIIIDVSSQVGGALRSWLHNQGYLPYEIRVQDILKSTITNDHKSLSNVGDYFDIDVVI